MRAPISALAIAAALGAAPSAASADWYQPPPPTPYWTPTRPTWTAWTAPPPRWRPAESRPEYGRTHLYVGAGGVGVAVLDEAGGPAFLDHGGGFELFIGVRVNPLFAIEAAWQSTFHDNSADLFARRISTIGLDAITAEFKLYLASGEVQPYLSIGAGAYITGDRYYAFAEGPGWQIGGGVDFWIGPYFSIGLKAQYRGIALIAYDVDGDTTYLSLFTGSVNTQVHF